ncbi:MAG: hypothetical protein LKE40_06860 [Spirochaetia bacterium]|nr:hypothetical protein [Spirochaetia bacterium]
MDEAISRLREKMSSFFGVGTEAFVALEDGFFWLVNGVAQKLVVKEFSADSDTALLQIYVQTDFAVGFSVTKENLAVLDTLNKKAVFFSFVYGGRERVLAATRFVASEVPEDMILMHVVYAAALQIAGCGEGIQTLIEHCHASAPAYDSQMLQMCPGTEVVYRNFLLHSIYQAYLWKQGLLRKMPKKLGTVFPVVHAAWKKDKLSVEFPFGDDTSLLEMKLNPEASGGESLDCRLFFPCTKDVLTSVARLNAEALFVPSANNAIGVFMTAEEENLIVYRAVFPPALSKKPGLEKAFSFMKDVAGTMQLQIFGTDWTVQQHEALVQYNVQQRLPL